MIKAILFDMDGVLIDSHDAWFYIFNKAYKKFENKQMSVEDFDKLLWAKAFDKVAKDYFSVPIKEIRDYYKEIYEDYRTRLNVIEGTEEALSMLKSKNIKLAVVSNTQRNVVERVMKDVGLYKYFDLFLGGDDVINGKPEPDILLKCLDILKLKKDEVLFVGDTRWDRMAAEKAKIKFIGFKQNGDKRIESLKELVEIV